MSNLNMMKVFIVTMVSALRGAVGGLFWAPSSLEGPGLDIIVDSLNPWDTQSRKSLS